MITVHTSSRRGALLRETPDSFHVRTLVLLAVERGVEGGRFARTNDTDISLPILQLPDFPSEHTARGRHDHAVKNTLEVWYRSFQAGEGQHARQYILPVNLDDLFPVTGFHLQAKLYPHVFRGTGLGSFNCVHNL